MKIIPAIDLKNGQCVRLYKGNFLQETIYNNNPLEVAINFQEEGSKYLHIIDLDATISDISNKNIIKEIAQKTDLEIQIGGGIKTKDHIKDLLDAGAKRVILGSVAVKNLELTQKILAEFGVDKIVFAFDVNIVNKVPMIAIGGWKNISSMSLWSALDFYKNAKHILCTDISRDGTLTSPNFEFYQEILKKYPKIELQASGGVSSLDDLKKLKEMGAHSVIVGKALYDKKFTLKDAIIS